MLLGKEKLLVMTINSMLAITPLGQFITHDSKEYMSLNSKRKRTSISHSKCVIQRMLKSAGIFPLASAGFANDVKVVKGIWLICSNIYPLDLRAAGKFQPRKRIKKKKKCAAEKMCENYLQLKWSQLNRSNKRSRCCCDTSPFRVTQ